MPHRRGSTTSVLIDPVQRRLDEMARGFLQPSGAPSIDFGGPPGEPALTSPASVSWRVFKNPVALFIGGVAAVVLELAEPRVRTGVWEHSSFRSDPVRRLQRTGLAAMVTIYGARSVAEGMIGGIRQVHRAIKGRTSEGDLYSASDPELLTWVQATAVYGFGAAYSRYASVLSRTERDTLFEEGLPAARLYGATGAPGSLADFETLLEVTTRKLAPSPIIFEFLKLMMSAPTFPAPLRPFQGMLVRAGVALVPDSVRSRLSLTRRHGLRSWEEPLVRSAAGLSDRIVLPSSPAVQACVRLGLPADFLYRRELQEAALERVQ